MTTEAIDSKTWAKLKVALLAGQVGEPELFDSTSSTPVKEFAKPWMKHSLSTGTRDFPWQALSSNKADIVLGDRDAVGLTVTQMLKLRPIVSCYDNIRRVKAKSAEIVFPDGFLAESLVLDAKVEARLAGVLSFFFCRATHV